MCAWITLRAMGKRDDRTPRTTREFDAAQLAALTKQPLPDKAPKIQAEPVQQQAEASIAFGRAATIDDPLTTGLLAEVTRRAQTTEFDDELLEEVLEQADGGVIHPHTRRRSAK